MGDIPEVLSPKDQPQTFKIIIIMKIMDTNIIVIIIIINAIIIVVVIIIITDIEDCLERLGGDESLQRLHS